MLVNLAHGVCVNPDLVKLIHVRPDRAQGGGKMLFSVVMKTDDDGFLNIATFDNREEAEALAGECAIRINKALGEEDPSGATSGGSGGGTASAADDDDDDAAAAADDDDW